MRAEPSGLYQLHGRAEIFGRRYAMIPPGMGGYMNCITSLNVQRTEEDRKLEDYISKGTDAVRRTIPTLFSSHASSMVFSNVGWNLL